MNTGPILTHFPRTSSPATVPEGINELLLDELRDILHAEKQLTKALPKMAQVARFDRLRECFEEHLVETEPRSNESTSAFHFSGRPRARSPAKA
jgi:manganese catalase